MLIDMQNKNEEAVVELEAKAISEMSEKCEAEKAELLANQIIGEAVTGSTNSTCTGEME